MIYHSHSGSCPSLAHPAVGPAQVAYACASSESCAYVESISFLVSLSYAPRTT